ncbi:hypothetical protein MKX07_003025 [Trichoderma sp. CBMAI-0711]|nr:hypothetical protein MKX07_003025 [Trichoderma sp. CBMAI-0711]
MATAQEADMKHREVDMTQVLPQVVLLVPMGLEDEVDSLLVLEEELYRRAAGHTASTDTEEDHSRLGSADPAGNGGKGSETVALAADMMVQLGADRKLRHGPETAEEVVEGEGEEAHIL